MSERAPLPYAWDKVRAELQRRLRELLRELGFGKYDARGGVMHPLNPTRNDRRPGSFVIWTEGDGAGAWKDYACGDQGDVIDLILYVRRLHAKIDAYWWALEFLGWGRGVVRSAEEDRLDRERREREAKAEAAKAEAEEREKSASLFKLWLSLPPIADTPAEIYLRQARRIDLSRLPHQPGALRWAREAEWCDPLTGEVYEWRNAMVSALTRSKRVSGLHVTLLKPDGSGKTERGKAKLMFGSARGAAIRLSSGRSGLSPTLAEKKGRTDPLVICEGIEDGLTIAAARPDYRVWAAGSLSLMGLLDWPACASAVVLAADNDWEKPAAMKAFEAVEAHWRAQAKGRPVKVVRSQAGKDFNDWARA